MSLFKKCFVIMPFSRTKGNRTEKYWTQFFNDFLKPALEANGYKAFRSQAKTNNITKKIVEDLARTDLVLAVLTDANPNVMWELGARHTLRNGTIMILAKGQRRPFDIQGHGVIEYRRKDLNGFTEELRDYIKSAEEERQDSPIATFLNQRITVTVHLAIGRLKDCVDIMKASSQQDYCDALQEIKALQSGWDKELQQVSVVIDDKIVLHAGKHEERQAGAEQWVDVTFGEKSLYPMMKEKHWGFRVAQIREWPNRLTAIAFEEVKPGCMVIAEAHYYQESRPY